MSSYDTLVIGGGLTGLLLVHRLQRAGQKVGLLEARESLGGRYRRQSQALPYSSAGLDFYPASNENMELLEWVKAVSPIPLQLEVREHRPQLYDEGRWRQFAGFGDVDFQSISELAHFSHTHEISIEPGLEQLVRALVEQLPIEAQTMSEVTGISCTEGKVSSIVVNGDKSLTAERVIFTAHPSFLNDLIEGDGIASKNRTRLAKMQAWTAVMLELNHAPPLADDSSIRIFTHSAKEFEPVVGRVLGERSKWMTLVPGERDSEHEFIGQCIRHIKRQLKRAWPLALEGQLREKIVVQANAYGQHALKTKDGVRFPELSNLYLANHLLASRAGEIAALEMVRTLEEELLGDGVPAKPAGETDAEEF